MNTTLQVILDNNQRIERYSVKNVLILYEEKEFYIGDTCIKFDQLRLCKLFFEDADIHINCINKVYTTLYKALLRNNPYLAEISNQEWEKIDFLRYDVIMCVTYDEERLLEFLTQKYQEQCSNGKFNTAIFSISSFILKSTPGSTPVFPVYEPLAAFSMNAYTYKQQEIYISTEEKAWANEWLKENNLQDNEQLIIVLDSSSRREKLLRIDVYFEVLKSLLDKPGNKILLFDEKNIGKEHFYKEWLGDEYMGKIIFARGLGLRNDLCILASSYTKMIFGPCTGLIHCASAIYNHFSRNGLPPEKVPVMITYTGKYLKEKENAQHWWGNSPLVNCLLLKEVEQENKMMLLSELSDEEKQRCGDVLGCNAYTAGMLTSFINNRLYNSPGLLAATLL